MHFERLDGFGKEKATLNAAAHPTADGLEEGRHSGNRTSMDLSGKSV